MKIFMVAALALLTFLSDSVHAAQTANARMYCLSIRFGEARCWRTGCILELDLTGISSGINGELYLISAKPARIARSWS